MDIVIQQILASSLPVRESVKQSEFKTTVKTIQDKIIELFRYTSLNLVPQFVSFFLKEIDEYVKSSDKRKEFTAAICLTAIIQLFPFDDYIPQYQPILEKLLRPGYKPLIKIAVMVLSQIAKIRGFSRDLFIRELIESNKKKLLQTESPDSRYAAAIIWEEVSESAPEHLYALGKEFTRIITQSLKLGDKEVCEILIHTIEKLINSESAPIGAELITELPFTLVDNIKETFNGSASKDDIIASLRLLFFILDVKPSISRTIIEEELLPFCIRTLESTDQELLELDISVICKIKKIHEIEIDDKVRDWVIDTLFKWCKNSFKNSNALMGSAISAFAEDFMGKIKDLLNRVDDFMDESDATTGPTFAFNMTKALIASMPSDINIEPILDNIPMILDKSVVPLPIHEIVVALNSARPNWGHEFAFFKYQILQVVREELTNVSNRTDRIMYSLLALNQIDNITFNDALEFNSLIIKLTKNIDIEVREMIAFSSIALFEDYPESIPLATIKKLVKFALKDPVRSVRSKSLKAFNPSTYRYLSQPDIFSIFSNFIFDECIEIRKKAYNIIRCLPVIQKSVIRNALLNAVKQTTLNFGVVVSDIEPAWEIFPDLITASGKMIDIYAESLFNKFIDMLNTRFSKTSEKERSLLYMNSAIFRTIDESLITSLTRLHIMCPSVAPIQPIIEIFSKILTLTIHPWTKIISLESLKDIIGLGNTDIGLDSKLMESLINIINNSTNLKLATKALKVIGAIGNPNIKKPRQKVQMISKSGIQNRNKFNKFFINQYFKYLVDLFIHNNLEATRDAICKCISCLFLYAPEEVQYFIPTFMDTFLSFIKSSKSPKLPLFYHYLTVMIEASGHLITPYIDKIFQAVEDNWHDQFTKEACIVLSSLVIATDGRCDSILNLVVSVSFLMVKSKKNAELFAGDLFGLLRVIAQYSTNFLSPIVSGLIDILKNPVNPSFLQKHSFDTIEFILRFCASKPHLPSIERCLLAVTQRSQLRWHDRARAILNLMDSISLDQPVEKYNFKKQLPEPKFPKFSAEPFIEKFDPPRHEDGTIVYQNISQWFITLRESFLKDSPNILIRTMQFLPSLPNFTFKFAFLSVWIESNESEKRKLTNSLSDIFEIPYLPDVVLSQFISLVEFATLCEIDLSIDYTLLVERCIQGKYFAKALFFLESSLVFHCNTSLQDAEISEDEDGQSKISTKTIEQLIILNQAANRKIEAKAIASMYKSKIKHNVWMKLGEWENAVEEVAAMPISPDNFTDRVLSYAGLDNWQAIHDMKDEFEAQEPLRQSEFARYFWIAEIFAGTKENALRILKKTGAYTVNDCIQKIILLIQCGKIKEAHDTFHLSWRYLASIVTSIERHNKTLIEDYSFQAAQLHELGDILSVLNGKVPLETITKSWKHRLSYLKEFPSYQVSMYKIRSLLQVEGDELEDFAFHILACSMKSGHKKSTSRLIDLLFHDKESPDAHFAELLKNSEEDIDKYKEILNEKNISQALAKRVQNSIGKLLLKKSDTLDELKQSLTSLQAAGNENEIISDVLTLLSYITKEESYALSAADAHFTTITKKERRSLMHTNQLFALLTAFNKSDAFKEKLIKMLKNGIPRKTFIHMLSTIMGLLLHPSSNVVEVATQAVKIMIVELPQVIAFDLAGACKANEDNELFEDLDELMQHEHPVYYSQMQLLATKLNKLSSTIYDVWIDRLTEAINGIKTGENVQVNQILKKLLQNLSQFSSSKYEEQFKASFNHKDTLQALVNKTEYSGRELAQVDGIIKSIISRQDSIRIIPLSSLDEQLEKKTTWSLSMLGKYKNPNIKIVKFFHSVQRWKNGFKISIIGSDGKKYNYHLKRRNNYKNEPSEHFMALIDSITPVIDVDQRSLIQISANVTLHELLKGYISLFDLISIYKQSKGQQAELEILNVSRKLDSMTQEQRERKIASLSSGESKYDLAKAIFVTSKNAMSWLQRTSTFAQSIGALSALSFIFGNVNGSPSDILFEKTTGATTFTAFSCTGKAQVVPFRLTPMLVAALGTCGVNGPFKLALSSYLESIRNRRRGLASTLQFVLEKQPFEKSFLPKEYISKYLSEDADNEMYNDDIDMLYGRITGDGKPLDEEISMLISKSQSLENLAKMPGAWVPWW